MLLSCNVNKSWNDVNEEINQLNIIKNDAVVISDAEPELIKSLVTDNR